MSNQWVLAWSQRGNAVRVQGLEEHLSENRQAYTNDAPGDHRALFIGSRDEVEAAANAMLRTIVSRSGSATEHA